MKISKDILLSIDLVQNNEWLDKYVELIKENEFTKKIKYETQLHHIVPKFYYTKNNLEINNDKENIVNLTIKDHILAHYYLCRCTTTDYKWLGYASINYILRNNHIKNLPELSEFLLLLDDIDGYYMDYRKLLAERQSDIDVVNKKKTAMHMYWENLKLNDIDRYNTLCGIRSNALKGVKKSEEHKKKLSVIASERVGEKKNPFYGETYTDDLKQHWSEVHGLKVQMIDMKGKTVLEFK